MNQVDAVDVAKVFQVIYNVYIGDSKRLRQQILFTVQVVAINKLTLIICEQKS